MRAKLLIENFFFFGVLKVVSAALPFFILPIIADYLPDPQDFAIYDNYTIIVSVLCSIAMMGSFDAMFREFYIKESFGYQSSVIKTGFTLVFFVSLITIVIAYLLRNQLSTLFFGGTQYSYLIGFIAFSVPIQTMNSLAISPSKMVNNRKHILFHTLMYAILFYSISLVLLELEMGFISLILGQLISFLVCLLVFGSINIKYFTKGVYESKIARNLLAIGLPLVPIFIIYWANNAIVRIFIVEHLGNTEMGVFALGSRYAAASSLLQMAFAGGWSYFTFSTMKDKDQVLIKSKVFSYLLLIICVFYYFVSLIYEPLFKMFFEGEYQRASLVFLPLFLAPLLLILYQIVANQFTIIGKSYISLFALSSGLVVNVAMAFYATSFEGSLQLSAASIPIGYMVTLMVVSFLGVRSKVFKIDVITIFTLILLTGMFCMQYYSYNSVIVFNSIIVGIILIVNRRLIKESFYVIMNIFTNKRSKEI